MMMRRQIYINGGESFRELQSHTRRVLVKWAVEVVVEEQ